MVRKALIIFVFLAGCSEQPAPKSPINSYIQEWQHKMLENRVSELESKLILFTDSSVIFKPDEKEFQFIRSDAGNMSLALQGAKVKGNGSEISLAIGNLTSADFTKCGIYLRWGEVNKDSTPIYKENLGKRVSIDGDLRGGYWMNRTFVLPDLDYKNLGFIEASAFSCETMKLLRSD